MLKGKMQLYKFSIYEDYFGTWNRNILITLINYNLAKVTYNPWPAYYRVKDWLAFYLQESQLKFSLTSYWKRAVEV